ncbi:hypothetical protein COU74_02975 [Candidatus Peregrinibacteria bacterium CG10_big_fil_rev_8_21_14_0_10_36_19]|nr:MAG: hypothetical protein COU74_02975 [Candidatus Peregrinibacteria bacterium CG10_big_fil_rev_8_21_14_0_10_36_19]
MKIEMILVLSLFSPLVEIFPNLYMSWWAPSNGKLQRYLDMWPRRVAVVFLVWTPMLVILSKIIQPPELVWVMAILIFSAFGLRLYFFKKSLKEEVKKISTNIHTSKLPEILYFIAFTSMGTILYTAVPNKDWLVPAAILTIFFGAFIISTFRRGKNKDITLDVMGRLIFTVGFLLNLYNLARAASAAI